MLADFFTLPAPPGSQASALLGTVRVDKLRLVARPRRPSGVFIENEDRPP
jgi:hypothetical protein